MKPFAVAALLLLAGLSGCAQTKDCRTASRDECPDSLVSAARQRLENLSPQQAQRAQKSHVRSDSMANARRELAPDFARRSSDTPYSAPNAGAANGWNERMKRTTPGQISTTASSWPRKPAAPSSPVEFVDDPTAKSGSPAGVVDKPGVKPGRDDVAKSAKIGEPRAMRSPMPPMIAESEPAEEIALKNLDPEIASVGLRPPPDIPQPPRPPALNLDD